MTEGNPIFNVLRGLLGINKTPGVGPPPQTLELSPGEAWSDAAIDDLGKMNPQQRTNWIELLLYAQTADGSKPSKKWLAGAATRISSIGNEDFKRHVVHWFSFVEKPRAESLPPHGPMGPDPNLLIEEAHAIILKGLAWACIGFDDPLLARSLGDVACAAYKKVQWHGPRCVKLGNAAAAALAAMPGTEPAAQLGRLGAQVKHP